MSQAQINQANGRLKFSKIGVTIEQIGERLYLVGTFPPKPCSERTKPYQQRISLGIYANSAGIQQAEKEARIVGGLLASKTFAWKNLIEKSPKTIGDWLIEAEMKYFETRERNPQTLSTWKVEFLSVFSKLPREQPLTEDILRQVILETKANSRTRRRTAFTCAYLADCAEIEHQLRVFTLAIIPHFLPFSKIR